MVEFGVWGSLERPRDEPFPNGLTKKKEHRF